MAHYALLNETNIVVDVFVGRDEDDLAEGVTDWEQYYAPAGFTCKRTSYNTQGGVHTGGGTPYRKNYAGIGYTYDEDRDAFIPPKPTGYTSWVLNETSCTWEAPVAYPSVTEYGDPAQPYLISWDEANLRWTATDQEDPQGSFRWDVDTSTWISL